MADLAQYAVLPWALKESPPPSPSPSPSPQPSTRYPVFPWVVADMSSASLDLESATTFRDLSKPVGALSEKRLHLFRERYESMEPGQRFLYGTHYSAPGFVAYFLLRHAPDLTLHLHGGRYDEPDRQFHPIAEAKRARHMCTFDHLALASAALSNLAAHR